MCGPAVTSAVAKPCSFSSPASQETSCSVHHSRYSTVVSNFYLTSRDTAILSLFDACSVNVYPGSCLHEHTPSVRLLLTNAMDLNEPSLAVKSPLCIVVIAISAFLVALDTAALGIRLWSRRLQGLSLCFNDYAMLLAWVCTAMRFDT